MLGFRFYFGQPHNRTWPMDGTLDWLWPAAEEAGMPVAVLADTWLPLLGDIAARHPALKLMVDHMGTLRGAVGDAAFPNMAELTALARYPNVAVKLTGGPFYADDDYPFRSLRKHYRAMYDAFGPQPTLLGHRYHKNAVLLAGVRHAFSGNRLDPRRRQEAHHGRRHLRLAWLEEVTSGFLVQDTGRPASGRLRSRRRGSAGAAFLFQHVCAFFRNHDGWGVGVGRGHRRHDGGVDHAQPI